MWPPDISLPAMEVNNLFAPVFAPNSTLGPGDFPLNFCSDHLSQAARQQQPLIQYGFDVGGCAPFAGPLLPNMGEEYLAPLSDLQSSSSSMSPATSSIHSSPMATGPAPSPDRLASVTGRPVYDESPSPLTSQCNVAGCDKVFRNPAAARRHERTHTRPEACDLCLTQPDGGVSTLFPDRRSLRRHMWQCHTAKNWGEMERRYHDAGDWGEMERTCPFEGCGKVARQDNLSRHHYKRHGTWLRWKRGRPRKVIASNPNEVKPKPDEVAPKT